MQKINAQNVGRLRQSKITQSRGNVAVID